MLMIAGIAAAIVARALRQQFENSVAAAVARDKVNDLFGQHVSPAVVDGCWLEQPTCRASAARSACCSSTSAASPRMTRARPAAETVALLNDSSPR